MTGGLEPVDTFDRIGSTEELTYVILNTCCPHVITASFGICWACWFTRIPFKNVPFEDPKSKQYQLWFLWYMHACFRLKDKSSAIIMLLSIPRPMSTLARGNSTFLPLYFPFTPSINAFKLDLFRVSNFYWTISSMMSSLS